MKSKKVNLNGVDTPVYEVVKGNHIMLNDGTLARVTGIDVVKHTVSNVVDLNIIKFEVVEGPNKGSLSCTPMFNTQNLKVVYTPNEKRIARRTWLRSFIPSFLKATPKHKLHKQSNMPHFMDPYA